MRSGFQYRVQLTLYGIRVKQEMSCGKQKMQAEGSNSAGMKCGAVD